jgi:hypothetical protein
LRRNNPATPTLYLVSTISRILVTINPINIYNMQLFIPVLALLSTLVAAVPTVSPTPRPQRPISLHNTNIPQASSDGRGATIFKDKNFKGQSTAIPANNFCTNINNIFGEFDGKIRSLTVEKGYQCKFYTYVTPITPLLLG